MNEERTWNEGRRVLSLPELVTMATVVCLVLLIPTGATVWVLWSQRATDLDVSRASLCRNALEVRLVQAQVVHALQHIADIPQVASQLDLETVREIKAIRAADEFICEEVLP